MMVELLLLFHDDCQDSEVPEENYLYYTVGAVIKLVVKDGLSQGWKMAIEEDLYLLEWSEL